MPVTIVAPDLNSAASVFAGSFLADFISGLIHWFEDRCGNPK